MSYSTKEIWVPTDKQAEAIAQGASSASPVAVQSGGANISRGLCYGYHIRASAAHATNGALPVKLFDASGGDTLYSTTADLSSLTEAVDTLATPVPFFGTPYFVIGATGGSAGTLTYTIRFFVKAMA